MAGMSGRGQETPEFEFEPNLGVAVSLGGFDKSQDLEITEPFPGELF